MASPARVRGPTGAHCALVHRDRVGPARDQFADCLLVQLPKNTAKRKAVRQVCGQLRTRRLGAVQPEKDIGESHLYLSLA